MLLSVSDGSRTATPLMLQLRKPHMALFDETSVRSRIIHASSFPVDSSTPCAQGASLNNEP